ncbi:unnamed protein product [Thlaspi arvense]|uniref:DUF8040 domain-containing protein n=1 Tax=Thlaspi arvense TaxID=13288 RepID=A0AAU9RUE6_THLAR|nr:unnamed protein product [Thlaspi arvense]
MIAFCICQLIAQGLENLSYEEEIELWNLENEQFAELYKLKEVWEGEISGIDCKKMMLLVFSYCECHCHCDTLQTNYGLQPTLNITIEEGVAMFLRICGHNEVQRDVGLRFRNQETQLNNWHDYIRTPTREELHRIPKRLFVDRTYYLFFSGFVGAMNGTHVCVKVKPELQGMY